MNLLALIYWLSLQSLAISVPAFGTEEGKDGVSSEISLDNEPAYYYSDNLLPPKALAFANKKTLVLDLDETLIHSSHRPIEGFHASLEFTLDKITWRGKVEKSEYWVYERPGLKEFLQKMSQMFEVVAWTAGTEDYGTKVLSHIDPNGEYFVHSLFRQHCTQIYSLYGSAGTPYTKELTKLGREMSSIMILDNSSSSYELNPKNGIPISDFLGSPDDAELKKYTDILTEYSSPELDITTAIPTFQREFDKKWMMRFIASFRPEITEHETAAESEDEFQDATDGSKTDNTLSTISSLKKEESYLLPEKQEGDKKILVVDLDETLIHSTGIDYYGKYHFQIDVEVPGIKKKERRYVTMRPFAKEFIRQLSKVYEIVIWTAAVEDYGRQIVDKLDPLNEFVSHRFYRQHCSRVMYGNRRVSTKPLRRLRSNTDDIIILDNSPYAYFYNPEVGIPIDNFYGYKNDRELKPLAEFIGTLATMQQSDMVIAIAEYVKQNNRWENIATKVLNCMISLCGDLFREDDI